MAAVSPVGAGLSTNLDSLMQAYQQMLGSGTTGASGAGSAGSLGALGSPDGLAGVGGMTGLNGLTGITGVTGVTGTDPAAAARSANFENVLGQGMQKLENLDLTAQNKAISAATGDLTDVHDYVIAATEAQTATELTTTLRNKALDSFNEIMRMPL